MPHKDPEKRKEYSKKYREKNKEKPKDHKKEYAQSEGGKKVQQKSSQKYNQTPAGIKARIIADWKRHGLIHDNYDELYELYLSATHCEVCRKEFENSNDRCMDHCHETGEFRQFLCRSCNVFDRWKNKV